MKASFLIFLYVLLSVNISFSAEKRIIKSIARKASVCVEEPVQVQMIKNEDQLSEHNFGGLKISFDEVCLKFELTKREKKIFDHFYDAQENNFVRLLEKFIKKDFAKTKKNSF